MRSKTTVLAGAAILALTATPTLATTHHHPRMHRGQLQESTPAERQQTADLNRQQLANAQTAGESAGSMSIGPGATLQTQPTGYQRSMGVSGSTSNNTSAGATGMTNEAPPPNATPDANMPQGNPSETEAPPPANPSGTPQ